MASTVGLWILVAIVVVIVVIVFTLPIQTSMKVTLIIAIVSIALAGYTIYAGMRQIERQDQGIEFGAIESMWNNIQHTFTANMALTNLYGRLYNSPTPETDPIMQMMAGCIEILIKDARIAFPADLFDIGANQWLIRISTWINNDEFARFWERNRQYYSPDTNAMIYAIWKVYSFTPPP